jgi:nucleoside phosphorylase
MVIHRGTIASGEAIMRKGAQRDALAQEHKILCFEMESRWSAERLSMLGHQGYI